MGFRKDGVVILLGAGCSKDAGIPTSLDMITDIEKWIETGRVERKINWGEFKELYYFVKSSILYAHGIKGDFPPNVNYNIEKLVNTLTELEKRESHPLYPFVGSWNTKLLDVAGSNFSNIKRFRDELVEQLKAWVTQRDYDKANYFSRIFAFKKEYNFPLRVFSLNYDLCLEKNTDDAILEKGFDDSRRWEWRRFEDNENTPADIYLYKMHGSIDWERVDGDLTYSDEVAKIENPDLIFGTNYKLQYVDPYLFYAYEFRRYTLESQLILTIGYGFGDEHINGIIRQALQSNPQRRLSCVVYDSKVEEVRKQILKSLQNPNPGQVKIVNSKAKSYMEDELVVAKLGQDIPQEEDVLEPQR